MGKKLAVISSTGGAGKTQLSVGLACVWSESGRNTTLVDVDPQDTTGASHWLDKLDEDNKSTANLTLVESSVKTISQNLTDIETTDIVLVDTPPKLSDSLIEGIAEKVDLVLVPGNIGGDLEAISQTASTILSRTSTPVLAVLCKLEASQMPKAQDIATSLMEIGAGVASTRIRRYAAADEARLYGDVPTQLKGDRGAKHANDLRGVAADIEQRLGGL